MVRRCGHLEHAMVTDGVASFLWSSRGYFADDSLATLRYGEGLWRLKAFADESRPSSLFVPPPKLQGHSSVNRESS